MFLKRVIALLLSFVITSSSIVQVFADTDRASVSGYRTDGSYIEYQEPDSVKDPVVLDAQDMVVAEDRKSIVETIDDIVVSNKNTTDNASLAKEDTEASTSPAKGTNTDNASLAKENNTDNTCLIEENTTDSTDLMTEETVNDEEDIAIVSDSELELITEEVNEETEDFCQEYEDDEIKITVEAPYGTFPQGAELKVNKAPAYRNKDINDAVCEVRAEANVALSYAFDIKVCVDDEEIQPDGQVDVRFALKNEINNAAEAKVYHVAQNSETKEFSAEELETDICLSQEATDKETIESSIPATGNEAENEAPSTKNAEIKGSINNTSEASDGDISAVISVTTEGFSYYVVEFYYGDLEYVMDGDSTVGLDTIMQALGLSGNVESVEVSNDELFSATNEGGTWKVNALQAFDTEEWMEITLDTKEKYKVKVLDALTLKYTITLDNNGGIPANGGTITATYGKDLPAVTPPTREGYIFEGYFLEKDVSKGILSDYKYINSDGSSNYKWDIFANKTLVAHWKVAEYTITLNNEGGSPAQDTITATYGKALPTVTPPTRGGYIFEGYYLKKDISNGILSDIKYINADGTSAKNWDRYKDCTLSAQWKESIAKIGTNYYSSIGGAISAAKNGDTIVLLKNTTESIEISGKNISLDLNNFKLTGDKGESVVKVNSGKLLLKNGTITSDKALLDSHNGMGAYIVSGAELTVEGVSFVDCDAGQGAVGGGVYNAGKFTMESGSFNNCSAGSGKSFIGKAGSTTVIKSGTVDTDYSVEDGATLTISGGWFKSKVDSSHCAANYGPTEICSSAPNSDTPYTVSNTYATVTYNFNGGTYNSKSSAEEKHYYAAGKNTIFTVGLYAPSKQYVNFGGWLIGTASKIYNEKDTIVLENYIKEGKLTFTAKWNQSVSKITFDSNEGTGGPASVYATAGEALPVLSSSSIPIRNGYTFTGYYDSKTNGTKHYDEKLDSNTNVWTYIGDTATLYAHWNANTYKITFDKANGTGGTDSVNATYASSLPSISVPTREGYVFLGYYSGENGSGTCYYTIEGVKLQSYNVASDITLHAYWKAITYTVTLDNNGGTPADGGKITVTFGQALPTVTPPTNGNLIFEGYFLERHSLADIKYINSDGTSAENWRTIGNQTLKAHWSENKYYLEFGKNGGEGSMETQTLVWRTTEPQHISENKFTKTGYSFLGWSTDDEDTTPMYVDKATLSSPLADLRETEKLYAIWKANTYKVTFDKANGTGGTDSVNATYGSLLASISAPTREGYQFAGYYTGENGTGKCYYTLGGLWAVAKSDIAENITLHAYWKAREYTVTLNNNGGTPSQTKIIATWGQVLPRVSIPAKEGYIFCGYYLDDVQVINKNGYSNIDYWVIPSNTTLKAKWAKNEYYIRYYKNNLTDAYNTQMLVWKTDKIQHLATNSFTRTGYTFKGWSDSPVDNGVDYEDGAALGGPLTTNPGETKYLYAVWSANTYKVTFDPQGGNGGTSTRNITYGSVLTVIDIPSRDNYTFLGYYTGKNGTGTKYYDLAGLPAGLINTSDFAADTTLYAYWKANEFTVTLNHNGGSSTVSSIIATWGEALPTVTPPTRQGYIFRGYYANITETQSLKYINADGTSANNWNIPLNCTLTAHWDKEIVKIGTKVYGSIEEALSYVKASESIVLLEDTTESATFDLYGKSITLDLNGNTLSGEKGESVITVKSGKLLLKNGTITSDKTLLDSHNGMGAYVYSGAELIVSDINFKECKAGLLAVGGGVYNAGTFIMNSGSFTDCTAGSGGSILCKDGSTTIIKSGILDTVYYAENGATVDISGGWFSKKVDSSHCAASYGPTEECDNAPNYYAPFTVSTASAIVKYDYNGGLYASESSVEEKLYYASGMDTLLTVGAYKPTRQYLCFGGFVIGTESDIYEEGDTIVLEDKLTEGKLTLTAKWNHSYTEITFNPNEGTAGPANVYATAGEALPILSSSSIPHKDGYTFAGYYDSKQGGSMYYDGVLGAAADIWTSMEETYTLYAHWTPNTYKIVYHGDANYMTAEGGMIATQSYVYERGDTAIPCPFMSSPSYLETFLGWTKDEGSYTIYLEDEGLISSIIPPSGDTYDLYPVFGLSSARIGDKGYYRIQDAVDAANAGDEIIVLLDSTENLVVKYGQDITLDLNGNTITAGEKTSVIYNRGSLIIKDSSTDKTGMITGGTGRRGLTDLLSNTYGGGIYNAGNLEMYGGTIIDCSADFGDAVYTAISNPLLDEGFNFTLYGGILLGSPLSTVVTGEFSTFGICGGWMSSPISKDDILVNPLKPTKKLSKEDGAPYDNLYTIGYSLSVDSADQNGVGPKKKHTFIIPKDGIRIINYDDPEYLGYEFTGWKYSTGEECVFPATISISKETTVYATWNPLLQEYKIHCYKQSLDSPDKYIYSETLTKQGYTDAYASLSEIDYLGFEKAPVKASGSEIELDHYPEKIKGDSTSVFNQYYNRIVYGLEYYSDEEAEAPVATQNVVFEDKATPCELEKAGYLFLGWKATGSSIKDLITYTYTAVQPYINADKNHKVKLYAVWSKEEESTATENDCAKISLVVNPEPEAPKTVITDVEVPDMIKLLNTEEKMAYENGHDITIRIHLDTAVKNAEDIPTVAKFLIDQKKERLGLSIGTYIDLTLIKETLYKKASGKIEISKETITDSPTKIVATIEVPEELRRAGRVFYISRVHGGAEEIITEGTTGDEIEISTDKFSTYTILYKDTIYTPAPYSPSPSPSPSSKDSSTTGSTTSRSGSTGGSGGGSVKFSASTPTTAAEMNGSWQNLGNNQWVFNKAGGGRYSGWGQKSYTNANGLTQTYWYHFGLDGIMNYGWFYEESSRNWYYLSETSDGFFGHMVTGWYQDSRDRNWYYFDKTSGKMLTGEQVIDGKTYYFNTVSIEQTWSRDANGNWIHSGQSGRQAGAMYSDEMTPKGWRAAVSGEKIGDGNTSTTSASAGSNVYTVGRF